MALKLSTNENILTFSNGFRKIELVKNSIAYGIIYQLEVIEVRGVTVDYEEETFHLYGTVAYQGLDAYTGMTDPNAPSGTSQNFQELVLFIKEFVDVNAMSGSDIVDALNTQLGGTTWQSGGSGSPSWSTIIGDITTQTDLQDQFDTKADASDISAANIKVLYESNANTNAFTDALQTKLSGVEAGATADQSNSEIEAAYNAQVSKVSAGEITAGTETTVRRFSPADIVSLLDTHQRTAAELKTAYESNANTNAFTDALLAKLTGIETAADVTDATNVGDVLKAFSTETPVLADYIIFHDQTDNSLKRGLISDLPGGGGGIGNIVEDLTPQLGGDLDLNSNDITGVGNINTTGNIEASGDLTGVNVNATTVITSEIDTGSNLDVTLGNDVDTLFRVFENSGTVIFQAGNVGSTNSVYVNGILSINGDIGVTGNVDGRNLAVDGAKLDLIEDNADVTDSVNVKNAIVASSIVAAEGGDYIPFIDQTDGLMKRQLISTLPVTASGDMFAATYDPQGIADDAFDVDNHTEGTTNKLYTAAEKTKLGAIEAGATADQTGAEIKALYEAEANTNAFTDALLTKLNGIETSATADQTGSEIKALYEAEADTNAFTDALLSKLNAIEASATADQTAAEIEALLDAYYGNSTWRSEDFKGIYDTKTALETAHPTTTTGDWAIVKDGIQLALEDGAAGWEYQIVEGYELSAGAITNLEDDDNWDLDNVYNGPSISGDDLIAGKKHENDGIIYECIYNSSANYWIRYGNRTIASLDFKLGDESTDATEDTANAVLTYRLPYAFYIKNVGVAAGAEGPTGAAAIIDVHAAGTTIFSTTKAQIADGSTTGDQTGLSSNSFAKGTLLEFFIDQVGSTQAGTGYSVSLQGFIIQA